MNRRKIPVLFLVRALSILGVVPLGLGMPSGAFAQTTLDNPIGALRSYAMDSGLRVNDGDLAATIYEDELHVAGAASLRLYFSDNVQLGPGSMIRLTSLQDGEQQELGARALGMWGYSSAYFNGDAVRIELLAGPRTARNRVVVEQVWVEEIAAEPTGGCTWPCGICGSDNRVPSNEPWSSRLLPAGCTASVWNEDSCMVSAGHCIFGTMAVQFNVPDSNPDCSVNQPPVADQFPVTLTSSNNGGVGADWAVMRTGTNNLGQTIFERYGELRPIASAAPAVGQTLDIWGYGIDDQCTRSQIQQTSTGAVDSVSALYFQHTVDATCGNSGSSVIRSGEILGIATHCPCPNVATRVDHPSFAAARDTLCGGGGPASDCCFGHATPGCDDPDCESAVCACDPFCCDTQWDDLCAGEGFVPDCGAAVLCEALCSGGCQNDLDCDDGVACTLDVCDTGSGTCSNTPQDALCEDGNACTIDSCDPIAGCVQDTVQCPGPMGPCDGGQSCNPATGLCEDEPDEPLSTLCDFDGDLCTVEHCDGNGACVLLGEVQCPEPTGPCDGGGSCNPATGLCEEQPDAPLSTLCDLDGNLCTVEHCDGNGACVLLGETPCLGPTGPCDGGEACNPTTGLCEEQPDVPLSTPCESDGDLCTIEHCDGSGACVELDEVQCPGPSGPCDGGEACDPTTGLCEEQPDVPLSTPCESDGNLCTIEHCDGSGACVELDVVECPGPTGPCDGGEACNPTTGLCEEQPEVPLSTPCESDGNLCTIEHCDGNGACVELDEVQCPGPSGPCDGGEACNPTTGLCEEQPDVPLSTPCESDGNLCTIEHCDGSGACVELDEVQCPGPSGPCDGGEACIPTTGLCEEQPDVPLSTPCESDGNLCTIEHCDGSGVCVELDVVECPGPTGPCDGGEACNPTTGLCEEQPDVPLSTPCESDGNLCTIEHCDGSGACVELDEVQCPGPTGPCDGGEACNPTTGLCEEQPDVPLSTPCESDGNLCTIEHCDGSGACVELDEVQCPGPSGPCDGGEACNPTTGLCEEQPDVPLSTPCESDGNLCTIEHCDGNGACVELDVVECPGPTGPCDGGEACNPTTSLCEEQPDVPLSTPCESDGNLCTIEHCDGSGACVELDVVECPGPSGPCDGGEACNPTTGLCEEQPDVPLSTPCESDADLCTIEHCDGSGACVELDVVECPGPTGPCDGGEACNPTTGLCEARPDAPAAAPCESDENLCTVDQCDGDGACVHDVIECPDGLVCNPGTGCCQSLCPADVDGDGSVGAADLASLLGAWGPDADHPADLNCDGSVGAADLALLLASWGSCR